MIVSRFCGLRSALCLLVWLAAVPDGLTAHAAGYSDMVIDVNSGKVLHETNADEQRFPASLAKMMTLYVTFDMIEKKRLGLDTTLVASDYDAAAQPSKLGLHPGDTISVRDGIKALVTASANDVARAIAENLGLDEEKFAAYMTWQARRIGMKDTTFKNASGLPNPDQTTTARDYITLSLHLYDDFPQYFGFFKTPYFQYGRARYRNHNGLLFSFQGSDGIKTGYTSASGFNLAASVHRNGKHLIGVIFGGRSAGERNSKMRALLTAGLARASSEKTRVPVLARAQVAALTKVSKAEPIVTAKSSEPVRPMARKASAPAKTAPAPLAEQKVAEVYASASPQNPLPGPFHVQIGAYGSEEEARQRLGMAMGLGSNLLTGHVAAAVAYNAPDRIWYRARFAGFDRPAADQTCQALKAKHLDCIVMRAN